MYRNMGTGGARALDHRALHASAVRFAMEYCLDLNFAETMPLFLEWARHRRASEASWHRLAHGSSQETRQRAEGVFMENLPGVVDWIDRQPAGVMLASIHMGDYLHAFFRLFCQIRTRKVLILRRRPFANDDRAFAKLDDIGVPFEIIFHGDRAAARLVRELGRGALALGFFDLTKEWGSTRRSDLLGRGANLAAGPGECAALAHCAVLPMASGVRNRRSVCDFGVPLEPAGKGTVAQRSRRIIAHVNRFSSRAIRERPEQWHHWNLALDIFFEPNPGTTQKRGLRLPVERRDDGDDLCVREERDRRRTRTEGNPPTLGGRPASTVGSGSGMPILSEGEECRGQQRSLSGT